MVVVEADLSKRTKSSFERKEDENECLRIKCCRHYIEIYSMAENTQSLSHAGIGY
jgi:hypothetical protein